MLEPNLFSLLFPEEHPIGDAKIIIRGRFPEEITPICNFLKKELPFHAEILFTKDKGNDFAVKCLNEAIDAIFEEDYDGPNYIGKFSGCEVFIPYNCIKFFEKFTDVLHISEVLEIPGTHSARLLKCRM